MLSKSIKVLHTEWSDGWGGQEIRIINEMLAVREKGVEVFLACRELATIKQKALEHQIPVFTLPFRGNADFKTLFALKKLVKQHQITIINTHSGKDTWVGGLAAKLAGIKFIRTRHLSNRIRPSRTNFINELADYIFTTGESVRVDMIKYNRIKPQRIQSIPTGIDAKVFDPILFNKASCRSIFNFSNEIVIGNVAVLRHFKRHDLFLRAARGLIDMYPNKRFKFVLAGEGPMREDIERQIIELNMSEQVVMLGYIDNVAEFLSAIDIFTLTSDSKEGVPQSIMQALFMGKPVVATNVGSVEDLYLDNNFVLVKPHEGEITQGLASIVADNDKMDRLIRNSRISILENFSKDAMLKKITNVYENL